MIVVILRFLMLNRKQPPELPQAKSSNSSPGQLVPPASIPPNKTHFERLLDVLDDHARLQLLEAIRIYQLETKDPFFVVMLAQVTISKALLEAPIKIRDAMLEASQQAQVIIDRLVQKLTAQAVKDVEREIAKSVHRLIATRELSGAEPWTIPILAGCSVLLVAAGGMGGWAFSQMQRSPIVPGKPVQLTERQVDGLRWLDTAQGQLARDVVIWNDGQIVACQTNQTDLFKSSDITVPGYGTVRSGACVLWVVPPNARQFEPEGKN
jgi:hypothetical protein